MWIGRGQCIEHFGAGEAYMPVLAALGRLCREPGGKRLIALLRQHASTWLVQMPALLTPPEREQLQREVHGATRERMLREMTEALEALTAVRPLVLVLEDLHWSDVSTLDLLAVLARRPERMRLLVIGTYRPVDMLANSHPLRAVVHELHLHRQSEELLLGLLSEEHIAEYLERRFAVETTSRAPLQRLANLIHRRTEGNPLFLVSVVEDLVTQGVLSRRNGAWQLPDEGEAIERNVPESIRQLVAHQSERLSRTEQQVLAAASVAGLEFSAAAVAAALACDVVDVEEQCTALTERQQFLRRAGIAAWPDGTVAARYGFVHALYQQLWHERVSVNQLQRWHLRIGECKEVAYGERAVEIATELAVHFEQGRDYRRTIQYLQQAGENAVRLAAHQEAITHLTKALELLKTLPDTPERAQHELKLQYVLGTTLIVTRGAATPEAERIYTRVQELCHQVGATPFLFWVQLRLWNRAFHGAESQTPCEHAEQLLPLPQRERNLVWRLPPALAQGMTLFFLGEVVPAREQLEQGIGLFVPQPHRSTFYGIACLAHAAHTLWYLGYPAQALTRSGEALALAQKVSHPYSRAFVLHWAAGLHRLRGEIHVAQAQAEALLAISAAQGFGSWAAMGTIWRGWALAARRQAKEGLAQLRQGVAARRALGAELWWTYYLALLGEALGNEGQDEEGLSLLTEALTTVAKTGERFYEAELYRVKGKLVLQSAVYSPQSEDPNPQSLTPNKKPKHVF